MGTPGMEFQGWDTPGSDGGGTSLDEMPLGWTFRGWDTPDNDREGTFLGWDTPGTYREGTSWDGIPLALTGRGLRGMGYPWQGGEGIFEACRRACSAPNIAFMQ